MEEKIKIEDLIQGQTLEEKLKSSIKIIETLEKENFKLRTELLKTEASLKKLQDTCSTNAQNTHNTSSAFCLPSEFRKNWESLIQEKVLDLFFPYFDSYKDLAVFVQELIKLIINEVSICIDVKVLEVMKILGCGYEKMESVRKYLLRMFQDNYLTAFPTLCIDGIKDKYVQRLPGPMRNEGKKITENSDFKSFVLSMHKISLHMLLNDPKLELHFPDSPEITCITKPDDFCCIDGFPDNEPEAAIIIPSILRHNNPYAGIKPSILILTETMKKKPSIFLSETKDSFIENSNFSEPNLKIPIENTLDFPCKKDKKDNTLHHSPKEKDLSSSQVISLYFRYKRSKARNTREDGQESSTKTLKKNHEKFIKCLCCKGNSLSPGCFKGHEISGGKSSQRVGLKYRSLTPNKPNILTLVGKECSGSVGKDKKKNGGEMKKKAVMKKMG